MSTHTPHELAEEFPDQADLLHILKTENAHFKRLADDYHTLNRQVHRAETNIEPMEDLKLVELRKQRMHLKDQIAAMLKEQKDA